MSDLLGTNIATGIVPFTTEDVYPTHYSKYGKGGWKQVASINERNNISLERRELGMIVYVLDENKTYTLKEGLSNEYWVLMMPNNGAETYIHIQGIASATWIIEHNLEKYPNVTIVTSSGTVVEGDVTYNSKNIITVTFNGAFKGKAYLN